MVSLHVRAFVAAILAVAAVASTASAQGALSNGANHAASITIPGEQDTWTTTLKTGERIVMAVAEPNGDVQAFVPMVTLYGPDGAYMGQANGYRAAHLEGRATKSGVHRIVVSSADAAGLGTGPYQLTIARMPANFVVPAGDQGGAMTNGANHRGTIHRGDIDQWRVLANSGETVVVAVAEASGDIQGFVPHIQIYGPDGGFLTQADGYRAAHVEWRAIVKGSYRVVVFSGDTPNEGAGDYQLTAAVSLTNFTVPSGDQGGPLTNGASYSATIHRGDLDQWTFNAKAGEVILLSVGEAGGDVATFVPFVQLYGPDGAYSGQDSGYRAAYLAITAPLTGPYRVVVASWESTEYEGAGAYQITLAHPPDDFATPSGDEGGPLANGAEHTGRIHIGDLDMWSFNAAAGASVSLRVRETGGDRTGFVPAVSLYGPAGEYRGFVSGYTEATLDVTVPIAGRYTVVVEDGTVAHEGDGSYTLRATGILGAGPAPLPQISGRLLGQQCESAATCQCVPTYCGNPIEIASGNKFQTATDYRTTGPNVLEFTRYYNSLSIAGPPTFATALGVGWRATFDRAIRIVTATAVSVERPSGRVLNFALSGSWRSQSDIDLQLAKAGGQWTLTDAADTVETYTTVSATQAVLTSIRFRNGYTQTMQYDPTQQLTGVVDSFGRSLALSYNGSRLASLTTPDGTTTTFAYSTSPGASGPDRLAAVTDGAGATQSYEYEDVTLPFALTGIVDENGDRFATWAYDRATGRAMLSEHAGGAERTTVSYDDAGLTRTVTNALGQRDVYRFTLLQGVPKLLRIDRLATAAVAAAARVFAYDVNGFLAAQTDWNGTPTTFVNDARGLPTAITEAAGTPAARVTTIAYDTPRHLPTQIEQPGITTVLTYDADGNVLTRTETDTTQQGVPYTTTGQTRQWTMTWQNGLLMSIDGPRTEVADRQLFTYDGSGNLSSATNGLSHVTRVTQATPGGRPVTIVNANGVTTTLSYDGRQRLVRMSLGTAAGALVSTYEYDAAGNLRKATLPDGSFTENAFDEAHRLAGVTDALGQTVSYTLDLLGNHTKLTIPASGLTRASTFDTLGRLLTQAGAAARDISLAYDSNGNALRTVDALGHATQRLFDAMNRQTRATDALGGVTSTAYDAMGRAVRITTPNGAVTTYVYDGFGRRIQEISPDRGKTVSRYDLADNLVQRVDAANAVANYSYDALNRMLSTTYPSSSGQNLTYRYDQAAHGSAIGRLTSVSDPSGKLDRSYDERGNVVDETRVRGAATLRTRYVYDGAGRLVRLTYPSGTVINYPRDLAGRITDVQRGMTPLVSNIRYQPFGPANALTYGNGIAETRQFDLEYRLTGLSNAVQNLSYNYDDSHNVVSILDSTAVANSQTFDYDELDRLTSATGSYGNLDYSYDANGNRLTQSINGALSTYSYTPQTNRLAQVREGASTRTFSYTPAGATSSIVATGTPTSTMAYSLASRLLRVTTGSSVTAQYLYDAFGHRMVRQAGAVFTLFQYDTEGHLLAETSANGQTSVEYVYLGDRPIATIEPGTGKIAYLHTDHLGTPQVATDAARAVVWKANYDPFGTAKVVTSLITQNLRLPGQEFEPSTGLHQNGFRDYMPGLGRYLESDPIGLVGGASAYGYAEASPVRRSDRLGLAPGPAYPTLEQAASAAVNDAWQRTLAEGVEYGGLIYRTKQGSFAYQIPVRGEADRLQGKEIWRAMMCETVYTRVESGEYPLAGAFHTHPPLTSGIGFLDSLKNWELARLSAADMNFADLNKVEMFVRSPALDVRYPPNTARRFPIATEVDPRAILQDGVGVWNHLND